MSWGAHAPILASRRRSCSDSPAIPRPTSSGTTRIPAHFQGHAQCCSVGAAVAAAAVTLGCCWGTTNAAEAASSCPETVRRLFGGPCCWPACRAGRGVWVGGAVGVGAALGAVLGPRGAGAGGVARGRRRTRAAVRVPTLVVPVAVRGSGRRFRAVVMAVPGRMVPTTGWRRRTGGGVALLRAHGHRDAGGLPTRVVAGRHLHVDAVGAGVRPGMTHRWWPGLDLLGGGDEPGVLQPGGQRSVGGREGDVEGVRGVDPHLRLGGRDHRVQDPARGVQQERQRLRRLGDDVVAEVDVVGVTGGERTEVVHRREAAARRRPHRRAEAVVEGVVRRGLQLVLGQVVRRRRRGRRSGRTARGPRTARASLRG